MKMNDILKNLALPEKYRKTEGEFWNDEYISAQMLSAHLDPEFEGASRKKVFVDQSATWIASLVPASQYPSLLDLGCGPGLYTERFAKAGYQVTGVDFSRRSIAYATQSAERRNIPITYHYQNYLELRLNQQFDVITMIYCDYGALSTEDRQTLLKVAYHHLKPDGRFLLDVFSMKKIAEQKEGQTWESCPEGGFWSDKPYFALYNNHKYSDTVMLSQTTVFTEDKTMPYYLWDTYYSRESLIKEAEAGGFHTCEVFGDVAGARLTEESDTLAILLKK